MAARKDKKTTIKIRNFRYPICKGSVFLLLNGNFDEVRNYIKETIVDKLKKLKEHVRNEEGDEVSQKDLEKEFIEDLLKHRAPKDYGKDSYRSVRMLIVDYLQTIDGKLHGLCKNLSEDEFGRVIESKERQTKVTITYDHLLHCIPGRAPSVPGGRRDEYRASGAKRRGRQDIL